MPTEGPPRVFLGTNVLFSGIVSPRGTVGHLLDLAASGRFKAVISAAVTAELAKNIARKAPDLRSQVVFLFVALDPEVSENPAEALAVRWNDYGIENDGMIIEAAIASEVDYLCTGDRGIQDLRDPIAASGIKVVSPRDLLDILDV